MKKIVFAIALCGMLSDADAAVLAHYFDGSNNYLNHADIIQGMTASQMAVAVQDSFSKKLSNSQHGNATNPYQDVGYSKGAYWFNFSTYSTNTSKKNYFSFSLSANEGYALDLSSVSLQYAFANTWGQDVNYRVDVYCDLNDGNGSQMVGSQKFKELNANTPEGQGFYTPADNMLNFDLSSLGQTSKADFVLYFFKENGSASTSRSLDIADVKINGDVVRLIPEPASLSFGILGLGLLLNRRRRI